MPFASSSDYKNKQLSICQCQEEGLEGSPISGGVAIMVKHLARRYEQVLQSTSAYTTSNPHQRPTWLINHYGNTWIRLESIVETAYLHR
jgi:hypothetical protein